MLFDSIVLCDRPFQAKKSDRPSVLPNIAIFDLFQKSDRPNCQVNMM
ncbi:MAG: hypothetical protein WCD53_07465 [Microcoleus sp.]